MRAIAFANAMGTFGNGISFEMIRGDASGLTLDEFRGKHGDAFLLVHANDVATSAADTGPTDSGAPHPANAVVNPADPPQRRTTPMPSMIVFYVKKKPGSRFEWVSVGRNDGNDLHLPHASVSRFHAMLRLAADGQCTLQDAKSANGTFIAGREVPKQGAGAAVPLLTGQSLRFGDVNASYLNAGGLIALVKAARKIRR